MKKTLFLTVAVAMLSTTVFAQVKQHITDVNGQKISSNNQKKKAPLVLGAGYEFKRLNQTKIKGAPRLTAPQFMKSGDNIIYVEKFGHAAPAIYDWDNDGKLDLLIGDYGGRYKTNLVVFKNNGKNNVSSYASEGYYAEDKMGKKLFIEGS